MYAHQICVQRWCNEKGDTTCEICLQQFKPGYTAPLPSPQLYYDGSPINYGENWEIPRRDLLNHQFIAIFNADRQFNLDFEYSSTLSTRSLICCRIVAIIFIVLLLLRHTLPIILIFTEAGEYSLLVSMLVALRIIGMIVPMYMMVKAIIAVQRFQYQDHHHSPTQAHEENEIGQSQLRVIHIQ